MFTLNLRMMKKFLWCAAAIILHLYSFAQNDSFRVTRNDTLLSPDTLIERTSTVRTIRKQPVYKLKPVIDIPVFQLVQAGLVTHLRRYTVKILPPLKKF